MKSSFFMREEIRQRILKRVSSLEKGYRQNMGLLGPEGIGKTHLVFTLFQTLSGTPNFIPIYVNVPSFDFETLVDKWAEATLRGVFLSRSVIPPANLDSLLGAADPVVPKTVEKIRRLRKIARREKTAASVKELFSLTGTLAEETSKKIILMLDEFQALESLPATDPFSLFGKEIMLEKDTLYLVTSSLPRAAREIFREKLSLLFSNFEILELEPLQSGDFLDRMASRIDPALLSGEQKRWLFRLTSGHPVYAESLLDSIRRHSLGASELFGYAGPDSQKRLSNEVLLELVGEELLPARGRLSLVFEKKIEELKGLAKDAMPYLKSVLAISAGLRKASEIASFLDRKIRETKVYLQRLTDQGFISKSGSFYYMKGRLFPFWLREVYSRRFRLVLPGQDLEAHRVFECLEKDFLGTAEAAGLALESRMEQLFRAFRDETIELEGKKFQCPQFTEAALRPGSGNRAILLAHAQNALWACQIFEEEAREEEVGAFISDLKKLGRRVRKKVWILLGGIEANAKLLAQEARVQLWTLPDFNFLLEMFNLPECILLPKEDSHETPLGALAESVHTA